MKTRKGIASKSAPDSDEAGYIDKNIDPELNEDQVDETIDDDNPDNESVSGVDTGVTTIEEEQAFNDSITKKMKQVPSLKPPK